MSHWAVVAAILKIKVISVRENAKKKHSWHHPHSRVAPNGTGFLLSTAPPYPHAGAHTMGLELGEAG